VGDLLPSLRILTIMDTQSLSDPATVASAELLTAILPDETLATGFQSLWMLLVIALGTLPLSGSELLVRPEFSKLLCVQM